MRPRILFVDDEVLVLQGLKRMLHSMRGEWEMEFVEGGDAALKAMEEAPCDIVISDMRMPGMTGAELLGEIMLRHPDSVRLILSGHADQELILQCLDVAHQYLSKPCDPEMLVATLRRAIDTKTALHNETVRSLVARMETLPIQPALYLEISGLLRESMTPIDEITQVIEHDPSMASKILQLINSAFFGRPLPEATIGEAVAYLGLDIIRSLILGLGIFDQFPFRVQVDDFYDHSFQVACVAREIARLEKQPKAIIEEAFTAGLLHDAGKLVLRANFPDEFEECFVRAFGERRAFFTAETETFGCAHAEIGAYLFGLWGLPISVVEAVALHHTPSRAHARTFTPLTAVHAANALVHRNHSEASEDVLDTEYLAACGLADRVPAWEKAVSKAVLL